MKYYEFPGFETCLKMMKAKDAMTQEDGFHWLRPYAAQFVNELIDAFNHESDVGLQCWLLELLGETGDPKTLQILIDNLKSDYDMIRPWAIGGLYKLNTKEAREALNAAYQYEFSAEEETASFRELLKSSNNLFPQTDYVGR